MDPNKKLTISMTLREWAIAANILGSYYDESFADTFDKNHCYYGCSPKQMLENRYSDRFVFGVIHEELKNAEVNIDSNKWYSE